MSSRNSALCDFCQQKPKNGTHPYCSKTCASQAETLCNYCHQKPKFGQYEYCGKNCAAQAQQAQGGKKPGNAFSGSSAPRTSSGSQNPNSNRGATAGPGGTTNKRHGPHNGQGRHSASQSPQSQAGNFPTAVAPGLNIDPNALHLTTPQSGWNQAPQSQPLTQSVSASSVLPNIVNQNAPSGGQPLATCIIPGCEEPVWVSVDSAGNSQTSQYCSKSHRKEAVAFLKRVEVCIMCQKLPQSEMDRFCSKACRDKANSKV